MTIASKKQLRKRLNKAFRYCRNLAIFTGVAAEIKTLSARQPAKELAEALEAEQRKTRVQQVEIESLAAVIARDRQRVLAETAVASRTIAEAEGRATQ